MANISKIKTPDGTTYDIRDSSIGYTTFTIAVSAWSSSGTATVSVSGVTSSNCVLPSPVPSSISAWQDAGIVCTAQGSGTLTFTADTVPTVAISMVALVVNGSI
ncbi:MAG: hypothetical protein IJ831_09435 [Spirochaetales bacterium]|nr:hypothetical protein [Spirochaetales bacterium]